MAQPQRCAADLPVPVRLFAHSVPDMSLSTKYVTQAALAWESIRFDRGIAVACGGIGASRFGNRLAVLSSKSICRDWCHGRGKRFVVVDGGTRPGGLTD